MRGERRGGAIGDAFSFISSAGARRQALERAHEKARTDLRGQQEAAIKGAIRQVKDERARPLAENRERFAAERSDLRLAHHGDEAVLRASWKNRTHERKAAWRTLHKEEQLKRQLEADHSNAAAREVAQERSPEQESERTRQRDDGRER